MAKSVKSTIKKRSRSILREKVHKPVEALRLKRLSKAQEKQNNQVLSEKDKQFYQDLKEEFQREKEAGIVFNQPEKTKKKNVKKVSKAVQTGKKKVSKKDKLDF